MLLRLLAAFLHFLLNPPKDHGLDAHGYPMSSLGMPPHNERENAR